jgi:hypothetical protein
MSEAGTTDAVNKATGTAVDVTANTVDEAPGAGAVAAFKSGKVRRQSDAINEENHSMSPATVPVGSLKVK